MPRRKADVPQDENKELVAEEQARRDFLKKAGRFAAVTPPSISLLLGTSLNSRAIAGSSGSRPGHGWGDGNHFHVGPPGQKRAWKRAWKKRG